MLITTRLDAPPVFIKPLLLVIYSLVLLPLTLHHQSASTEYGWFCLQQVGNDCHLLSNLEGSVKIMRLIKLFTMIVNYRCKISLIEGFIWLMQSIKDSFIFSLFWFGYKFNCNFMFDIWNKTLFSFLYKIHQLLP